MMMMIKIPLVNWSAIKLMKNQRGGQAQLQQRVHLVNLAEAALLNQEDLVILFPTLVVGDIGLHGQGRIVHLKLHFIHSKTKEVNEYIVIFDPKTIQADYFFYFFLFLAVLAMRLPQIPEDQVKICHQWLYQLVQLLPK